MSQPLNKHRMKSGQEWSAWSAQTLSKGRAPATATPGAGLSTHTPPQSPPPRRTPNMDKRQQRAVR